MCADIVSTAVLHSNEHMVRFNPFNPDKILFDINSGPPQ